MIKIIKEAVLNTWTVQYMILVLFFVGIISKCWLNSYYTRKIKKSENILHTKDKILKQIALKYESCYRMNGYVNNASTMAKKYFYREKKFGMNLNAITHISDLCKLLSVLLCTAASSIIYSDDGIGSKLWITITFSVYAVIVLEFFDRVVDISNKEKTLLCFIEDYLENTLEEKLKVSQVITRKDVIENEVRRQAEEHLNVNSAADNYKNIDNRKNIDSRIKEALTPGNERIIADVLEEYL